MQILKWVPDGFFLLMVNFLLMVTNFTWTCFHLSQDYLCLICSDRQAKREKVCEGEKRERGICLIEENFFREMFEGFFLRFRHFFPLKCFPDQNYLTPTKKSPCRKFCPTNTISEDTLIYVKKKALRMTFV